MNRKKNYILVAGFSLSYVVMILISILLYLGSLRSKNGADFSILPTAIPTSESAFTPEVTKACWEKIENNLIGKWQYIGGELEPGQEAYLILYENSDFRTEGWGGDGSSIDGKWYYAEGKISLDFHDDNPMWASRKSEEITDYFEDTGFDENTKTLTVPISYIEMKDEFNGECKLNFYYINMLNYFLHKQD